MALLERTRRVSDRIPTASMADVAFLLLIFFLTTTVFEEEKGLAIVLPEDQTVVEPIPLKNIIHFLIREDGAVIVRRGESTEEQVVAYNEVGAIMRREIATNPKIIAAVKTAPDAPYRYMINVLDLLEKARAERISLQVWAK